MSRAISIVRDFRSSTRSVLVGYSLWTAHGANLVRSLAELGSPTTGGTIETVVDTRLYGDPDEVYEAALELMLQDIRGVTVVADANSASLAAARRAADESLLQTYQKAPPLVLGRLPPPQLSDEDWRKKTASRITRAAYVSRLTTQVVDAKLHGLIVDWCDLPAVQPVARRAKLPLCITAQRPASDPDREREGHANLAAPADLLKRGADTVLYDVVKLLGHADMEWASDRLAQSMAGLLPKRKDAVIPYEG